MEKDWLTKYMWTGDETPLPVKAEALKIASEYTRELEARWNKLKSDIEHHCRDGAPISATEMWAYRGVLLRMMTDEAVSQGLLTRSKDSEA